MPLTYKIVRTKAQEKAWAEFLRSVPGEVEKHTADNAPTSESTKTQEGTQPIKRRGRPSKTLAVI